MGKMYLGGDMVGSTESSDIKYDNGTSKLSSTNVKGAIDEVNTKAANAASQANTNKTNISNLTTKVTTIEGNLVKTVEITEANYLALEAAGNVDPNTIYFVDDGK